MCGQSSRPSALGEKRKSKEVEGVVGVEPTEPHAGGHKFHGQAVKDIFVLELFAG